MAEHLRPAFISPELAATIMRAGKSLIFLRSVSVQTPRPCFGMSSRHLVTGPAVHVSVSLVDLGVRPHEDNNTDRDASPMPGRCLFSPTRLVGRGRHRARPVTLRQEW